MTYFLVCYFGITYAARGHLARYMDNSACGTQTITTDDNSAIFEFTECHGKTCLLTYKCIDDQQTWLYKYPSEHITYIFIIIMKLWLLKYDYKNMAVKVKIKMSL
mgnify:CR=1 FL=1